MAHGVVRTDKLAGTENRAGIISVRYQPSSTETAIDNGNVVEIAGLETGSREVYVGNTPTAESELKNIVLIASPEVMYDDAKRSLEDFYNEAGKIARGYYLSTNNIFSVTKDALDGEASPSIGDIVELKAGTKLNVVKKTTGLTGGSTQVGTIIDINTVGRFTYYAIQVA